MKSKGENKLSPLPEVLPRGGKGENYDPKYKKNKTVDQSLHEIIIGLLLGDAFDRRDKMSHNTRLQIKQSITYKEYVNHLYELFFKFVSDVTPRTLEYYDKQYNKVYYSAAFDILAFLCFNNYPPGVH